ELLEPNEVGEVPMLLGCPSRVERRDRRCRGRRKDRRRLDELRAIVPSRTLGYRRDERHVAGGAERAQLRQAEPVRENENDLSNPLAKSRLEGAQPRWIGPVRP